MDKAVVSRVVRTAADRREFIDFPKRLYRGVPQWVPMFDADMKKLLTRNHPYFAHSPAEFFLFAAGERTVGRLMVMANSRYNGEHGTRCSHFYFADFPDEQAVSTAIFRQAAQWARGAGQEQLIGPLFSGATVGGGVLVAGFEHRAAMTMMGYNYDYYERHYERAGFTKRFDLLSLRADPVEFRLPERVEQVADRVRARGRMRVVPLRNRHDLRAVADRVGEMYNPTLADHAENYPLTEEELDVIKKDLLVIAKPELEKVIEYDDKVIGYVLSFPDVSAAMQRNRGRLGVVPILRLLRERRRTPKIIFNGMGILEEYQRIGGNALLYSELVKTVTQTGGYSFEDAEMCQINEETDLMLRDMQTIGAEIFKRHRVYERDARSSVEEP
jgi:hypothetical protein